MVGNSARIDFTAAKNSAEEIAMAGEVDHCWMRFPRDSIINDKYRSNVNNHDPVRNFGISL
jgi:hypothetical protein